MATGAGQIPTADELKAAGWTQDANGNWQAPAAPGGAPSGSGSNVMGVDLSAAPPNISRDPNAQDNLQQQTDYAMSLWNANQAGIQQWFTNTYPDLAWMAKEPGMLPILIGGAVNGWGQGIVDGQLANNPWWKANSASARSFYQQQAQDPASAAQAVGQNAAQLQQYAAEWGVSFTPDQLNTLATQATALQWNPDQMKANVKAAYDGSAAPTNQGATAQLQQVIQSVAGDYLMPADANTIKFWTNAVMSNGSNDPSQAAAQLQASMSNFYGQTAAQRFPWMKTAIASGMTPKDYLAPYTSQAAKTLSVAPDSINWADPKWQGALLQTDNTGAQVPKNADQFNKALMQDPQFGYSKTQGAIDQAYAVAQQITTAFGKVK